MSSPFPKAKTMHKGIFTMVRKRKKMAKAFVYIKNSAGPSLIYLARAEGPLL